MTAKEQGADATTGRWLTIPRTLCFVFNRNDVLLMKRAAHKRVFPNRYNGLGGHVERDEDIYSAAKREVREESGLEPEHLQLCGIHTIDVGAASGIVLFVFRASTSQRELYYVPDEGTLHWLPVDRLSEYDLVEDLPLILPRIMMMREDASPYFAHVTYNQQDQIQIEYAESRKG
jgi:8-oxo-dGTP diphosphatase